MTELTIFFRSFKKISVYNRKNRFPQTIFAVRWRHQLSHVDDDFYFRRKREAHCACTLSSSTNRKLCANRCLIVFSCFSPTNAIHTRCYQPSKNGAYFSVARARGACFTVRGEQCLLSEATLEYVRECHVQRTIYFKLSHPVCECRYCYP